jgi:predicted NAD/FAD-dependent oxidoreductase
MNALPKRLLQNLTLHTQTRVTQILATETGYQVFTKDGELGQYDTVVLSVPAPQALAILGDAHPFSERLARVQYAPCWAGMAHVEAGLPFDGGRILAGPLAWIGRQDTLPGRTPGERWILHGTSEWSATHIEDDPAQVGQAFRQAFQVVTGRDCPELMLHRWRFSKVTQSIGEDHLQHGGLMYAGDGCLGGRIEDAWLSGVAAAGAVLRRVL